MRAEQVVKGPCVNARRAGAGASPGHQSRAWPTCASSSGRPSTLCTRPAIGCSREHGRRDTRPSFPAGKMPPRKSRPILKVQLRGCSQATNIQKSGLNYVLQEDIALTSQGARVMRRMCTQQCAQVGLFRVTSYSCTGLPGPSHDGGPPPGLAEQEASNRGLILRYHPKRWAPKLPRPS